MADVGTSQVTGRIYEFYFGKMQTSNFITLKEKPGVAMDNYHFTWGKTKCLIVVSMP
jgi:hypothetical protein